MDFWEEQQQKQDQWRQQLLDEASHQENMRRTQEQLWKPHFYDYGTPIDESGKEKSSSANSQIDSSSSSTNSTGDSVFVVLVVPFYPLTLLVWILAFAWAAVWTPSSSSLFHGYDVS